MSQQARGLPPHLGALAAAIAPYAEHPTLGALHRELTSLSEKMLKANIVVEPGLGPSPSQELAKDVLKNLREYVVFDPPAAGLVKCSTPGCNGWRKK